MNRVHVGRAIGAGASLIWLGAAATFGIGVAKADSSTYPYDADDARVVCHTLDQYPGDTGATMVAMAAIQAGLDGAKAGRTVYAMVAEQCPSHTQQLVDWADRQ